MALESLTHKVFNVRTDVWAYGVTVWELFSLAATPYPGWETDGNFVIKLQNGCRMERPEHCPKAMLVFPLKLRDVRDGYYIVDTR